MEKINSLSQLNEIINEKKRLYGRLQSNSFLLPNEIEDYIRREKMYVQDIVEGILILCDEVEYYHVYYYCSMQQASVLKEMEKPLVMDFTFKGIESQKIKQMKEYWVQSGFKHYKRYERMRQKSDYDNEHEIPYGYLITAAKVEQIQLIRSLWESSLDIYSIPLPDMQSMTEMIEKQKVYTLTNESDELCGAAVTQMKGNTCIIEHVVITPNFRGWGLGEVLVKEILNRLKDKGITTNLLWVDENNVGALALYEKCGFISDEMKSDQYLLDNER